MGDVDASTLAKDIQALDQRRQEVNRRLRDYDGVGGRRGGRGGRGGRHGGRGGRDYDGERRNSWGDRERGGRDDSRGDRDGYKRKRGEDDDMPMADSTADHQKAVGSAVVVEGGLVQKFERSERPEVKQGEGDRKRARMFGNLLKGTLMRAQKESETIADKTRIREEKEKEVVEKMAKERHEEIQEHKRLLRETKQREIAEKSALTEEILAKEHLLLSVRRDDNMKHAAKFIKTKAEPEIFYLPAKHTPATERLLQDSANQIHEYIKNTPVENRVRRGRGGADDGDEAMEDDKDDKNDKNEGREGRFKEDSRDGEDDLGINEREGGDDAVMEEA